MRCADELATNWHEKVQLIESRMQLMYRRNEELCCTTYCIQCKFSHAAPLVDAQHFYFLLELSMGPVAYQTPNPALQLTFIPRTRS